VSTLHERLSGRLLPNGSVTVWTTGSGSKTAHDSLLEIGRYVRVRGDALFKAKRSTTLVVVSELTLVNVRRTLREDGCGSNAHGDSLVS
jgi:hypothetical protein